MKICKVVIENYQQFKYLELDFTHPETGEPLDNICFIGSNGTGKSTLLGLLLVNLGFGVNSNLSKNIIRVEFTYESKRYCWLVNKGRGHFFLQGHYSENYYAGEDLSEAYYTSSTPPFIEPGLELLFSHLHRFALSEQNLIVNIDAESDTNNYKQVQNVPTSSLDTALKLRSKAERLANFERVDQSTVSEFWKNVIYHTAQREKERNEFENRPENLSKTKRQLIDEFDQANPKILDKLALLWNRILEKAGLEFDVENAKLPVQLTDNLYAYIKLKATGERINYSQLSTGIRNFIFRVGHIYSLYFNREIENGFLFVDEPENSLFPDFLLDLLDIYKEITTDKNGERNTQMFFATHNPIVAAQFQPYERIILEWTEAGDVVARRGTAPIGDDPNDVLIKDFEISSLMPQAGVAMWEKYLDLKRKLRTTTDDTEKEELVTEILEIGSEYNFPRDQPKP